MKKEIDHKLIDCIGIENVKLEEPMEKPTTIRIGGPEDYLLCPQTAEELKEVLIQNLPKLNTELQLLVGEFLTLENQ